MIGSARNRYRSRRLPPPEHATRRPRLAAGAGAHGSRKPELPESYPVSSRH